MIASFVALHRSHAAGTLTASQLHNRLAAMLGDEQAHELTTTPNADLGGFSPLDLLEQGNPEPVRLLLENMERQRRTDRKIEDFIESRRAAEFEERGARP